MRQSKEPRCLHALIWLSLYFGITRPVAVDSYKHRVNDTWTSDGRPTGRCGGDASIPRWQYAPSWRALWQLCARLYSSRLIRVSAAHSPPHAELSSPAPAAAIEPCPWHEPITISITGDSKRTNGHNDAGHYRRSTLHTLGPRTDVTSSMLRVYVWFQGRGWRLRSDVESSHEQISGLRR